MKKILIPLVLIASSSVFSAVAIDECFEPISKTMNTIASVNSKEMGFEMEFVDNHYKIKNSDSFFVDLDDLREEKSRKRQYEVQMDNGDTVQPWIVSMTSIPEVGCMVRSLESKQ